MDKNKLKKALMQETGCAIQHNGWTCGSCFFPLADELNLKEDSHMYWPVSYTHLTLPTNREV